MKWECKYHVVLVPKYRSKKFFEGNRRQIGEILRELCRQKGFELLEGKAMPDHTFAYFLDRPKLDYRVLGVEEV